MSIVFIFLAHLLILLLIHHCWKLDSGRRIVFTPFVIFIAVEMVFTWSTWLLWVDSDIRVSEPAILLPLLSTFCFCVGFLFASKYIRDLCGHAVSSEPLTAFLNRPWTGMRGGAVHSACFLVLLFVGILSGAFYYRGTPPTVQAIAKLAAERELTDQMQTELHDIVVLGRRELTKDHVFAGAYRGQGVFRSFMVTAWSYGMVLAFLLAVVDPGRKRRWTAVALLFLAGAFYYIAGTGERSRFAWSLLTVLFGLSFVSRIGIRKWIVGGAFLLAFLMMMTLFLKRYEPVETGDGLARHVAASIIHRIAAGNKISNVRIMNFLADGRLRHTFGANHLREWLNVLPGIHRPPLGHEVGEILHPGRTTYFNGTYLSIVYIDFGWPGVAAVYFLMGLLVRTVFYFLLKLPKDPSSLAFLSIAACSLGTTGFRSGIVSFLVAMVPAVLVHGLVQTVLKGTAAWRLRPAREVS